MVKYWLKLIGGIIIAALITWGLVVLFNKYNTLLILFILLQAWRIDVLEKLVKSKTEHHENTHEKIYAAMDRLQERTEAKTDRLCDRLYEVEDYTSPLRHQKKSNYQNHYD